MRFTKIGVILLALISIGFAQDSLSVNTRYLNFEISRTPFVSGGYFLQNRLALEAGIGFNFDGESGDNGLGIRLGLDHYLATSRLSPFVGGYMMFEINPNVFQETFWNGSRLIFGGQWGLNLFILDHFAVAGSLGAELILNSPKEGDNSTSFTSMTSGLKMRFFF
jgi:hypothetical protein